MSFSSVLAPLLQVLLQGLAVHGPWAGRARHERVLAVPHLVDGDHVLLPIPFQLLEQLGLVHGEHVLPSVVLAHAGLGAEVAFVSLVSWACSCHERVIFFGWLFVMSRLSNFLHNLKLIKILCNSHLIVLRFRCCRPRNQSFIDFQVDLSLPN